MARIAPLAKPIRQSTFPSAVAPQVVAADRLNGPGANFTNAGNPTGAAVKDERAAGDRNFGCPTFC